MKPETSVGERDLSLASQIYHHLREEIIDGRLAPGTRLREHQLAERLQVSRNPIREAIPQLEAEGLVQTVPRRGTVVTQLTLRDVRELFDVREQLEGLAARLAASRFRSAGAPDLGDIERLLVTAREAVGSNPAVDLAELSEEFHQAILTLSENTLLIKLMKPISGRVKLLFRKTMATDQLLVCNDHEALVEAIKAGDPQAAHQLAFDHIRRGRQSSLELLCDILPE